MPTTIDLGKIKINWRGAFVAATSYEVDDAVSYDGSSYICTTANSDSTFPNVNGSKWDVMAAGAAPLTAAGQLLSHNGSAAETIDPVTASVGDVLQKESDGGLGFGTVQGTYRGIRPLKPQGMYYDDGRWGKWQDAGTNFYERGWLHMPAHTSNGTIDGSAYAQGESVPYRELSFPLPKPVPHYIGPDFMTANVHMGHYHAGMGVILEDRTTVFSGDHTYLPTEQDGNPDNWQDSTFIGLPGDKMGMFPDGDYPVQIVGGQGSWYLLMKSGDVWSCGYNGYGQLGHNDTTAKKNWQKIKNIGSQYNVSGISTHITAIAVTTGANPSDNYNGYTSVFFLDVHGRLFSCGYNGEGILGTGDTTNRSVPNLLSGISNVDRFGVSGSYHERFCYALTTDNQLFSWGDNSEGQLGLGDTTDRTTPTLVSMQNVKKIYPATYGYHNGTNDYRHNMGWIINESGEMYGTGYNGNSYLGVGDSTQRTSFTRVGNALFYTMSWSNTEYRYPRYSAIERTTATAPIEIDECGGQLYTWGYNANGDLLTGDTVSKTSPTMVTETSSQMVYDQLGSSSPQYTFDPTNVQYHWWESAQGTNEVIGNVLQDANEVSGDRTHWVHAHGLSSGQNFGWYYRVNTWLRDGYTTTNGDVDGPMLAQAVWNYEDDSIYATKLEFWCMRAVSSAMNHFYLTSDDYIYAMGANSSGIFGTGANSEQIKRTPRRLFIASGK